MAVLHGWGLTQASSLTRIFLPVEPTIAYCPQAIDEHGWPPYAATLRLDLLKVAGEGSLWVRVAFADQPVLCGGRDVWPFEAFLSRAEGSMYS